MKNQSMEKVQKKSDFLYTNPGNRMEPVYERVFDKDLGCEVVKKVREIDIYEYIQSSASSTDMAQLRAQLLRTGEVPCVDPTLRHGEVSLEANNIHEFYNLINGAAAQFDDLDPKVQAIFGSREEFVKALIKHDAYSTIVAGLSKEAEPVVEASQEVKEGE